VRKAYDVAAVRSAEAALAAQVLEGTLMARASAGLARVCVQLLGTVYGSRVALLIGAGDNGGDALYAGALLAARGARVEAVLVQAKAHDGGLAALRAAGGRVIAVENRSAGTAAVQQADLVVDGIVGIGGRGGLREPAAELVASIRPGGTWRVAVDLPSGVDADTGRVEGAAFDADVTVSFGALKPGLVVGRGIERAGIVDLVDIGLDPFLSTPARVSVLETADVADLWPVPGPDDDKYTRGVVGVAAGSPGYPGAAVLCTGGALRSGAGMVRYLGEGAAAASVAAAWPEVVHGDGRVQAYVVGPGLGTDAGSAAVLRRALETDVPVLIDADALTLLAGNPEWVRGRHALTVLTPHDREFARFGSDVGDDRAGAAARLAGELGVTVLLKGFATIVAQPDGTVHANPTGTSWLATAGSGDVLSGIIGTLLAAGLGPQAPVVGAFVHGLAGRLAALSGPISAMSVATAVPRAVAAVLRPDDRIES